MNHYTRYSPQEVRILLVEMQYKRSFYQATMVACSTLLGVLIALLPQSFRPTEARTLYLYCCVALALCSLVSGALLYVQLRSLAAVREEIRKDRHRSPSERGNIDWEPHRLAEGALALLLYFLVSVVFGLLFCFLAYMLYPDSSLIETWIPRLPTIISRAFILVVLVDGLVLAWKINSSSK